MGVGGWGGFRSEESCVYLKARLNIFVQANPSWQRDGPFSSETQIVLTPHICALGDSDSEGSVAEDLLGVGTAGKAGSLTKIKQKMFLILNPSVITDVLISGGKGINHAELPDSPDLNASRNVFKGH